MIELKETVTIAAPLDAVWPLLRDPARVAACIPGAAFNRQSDDGLWHGTITVRFGPTVAVFTGRTRLDYDDAAHTCRIEGSGTDRKGASRTTATLLMHASGGATTQVGIEGECHVTGPLESFANAGGVHVARALIAEFAAAVAAMAQPAPPAGTPEAAAAPPPPSQPRASLSAPRMAWLALRSWLRSLRTTKEPQA